MKRPLIILSAITTASALFLGGCSESDEASDLTEAVSPDGDAANILKGLQGADKKEEITADVALKLQVGDIFPMMKTVEQFLLQEQGNRSANNQSTLKLAMRIRVAERQDDKFKLDVVYDWLQYTHNIGGRMVEYHSRLGLPAPPEIIGYAGMAKNGFSIWLNSSNKIERVEGFREFLEKCMERVPVNQRQAMLNQMADNTGDAQVANFIDDSIGMLSFDPKEGPTVTLGETWKTVQRMDRPVPMFYDTRYTVVAMDENQVELAINGQITSVAGSANLQPTAQGVIVNLGSGEIKGTCTIRRNTGLPIRSRIERKLRLMVTSGGQQTWQEKRIVTTIEAFPQQPSSATNHNHIMPVSGETNVHVDSVRSRGF